MRQAESPLVLVVDDDAMVRFLSTEALEPRGFRVLEADNGADALKMVDDIGPDIILLDVMMPGLNGFTVCSRLRVRPNGQHIPVLMMTGLDDADSILHAYQVGATDFITKPINFSLLEFRLRYMLRSKVTGDELRQSEGLLASAQRIARLGHFVMSETRNFSVWNAQTQEVLGLANEPTIGTLDELLQHVHADDRKKVNAALVFSTPDEHFAPLEYRIVPGDGEPITIVQHSRSERTDTGLRITGTVQDISEQRSAERTIHQLAYFDQITGLPNRIQIEQRLSDLIHGAQASDGGCAVLALDLDHFQRVNDTFGHDAGNELLRGVARRLIQCLRQGLGDSGNAPADLASRSGGDEFCLLLPGVTTREQAKLFADRVHFAMRQTFLLKGEEVVVTASIGVSLFPEDGRESEALLRHADIALFHAKRQGRDGSQFFHPELNERAQARLAMENHLRQALGSAQISLHYQPKIEARSGAVTGMEALVRWHHPVLGRVPPSDFIPVAEESGLILALGEWTLGEACRQTVEWRAAGLSDLICAVNLSTVQLRQDDFPALVARTLASTGLPPANLQLELTESVLMDSEGHTGMLDELKRLGVTLAIDDFGTGYSSLSYLTRLPIDVLKIDQSFVRDMRGDGQGGAIVTAIIAMGHGLGLKIVAEGVETPEQLGFLQRSHCDEIQGYFFSKPLPASDFPPWVNSKRAALDS